MFNVQICPDMSRYVQICPDMSRYVQSDWIRISWYMLAVGYVSNIWGCDCHPDHFLFKHRVVRQSANVLTQAEVRRSICWTHTMWAPPVIRWFINPMNTIVIGTLNHSYWSYVHQLSYRLGAPLCRTFLWSLSCPILPEIDTAESNGGSTIGPHFFDAILLVTNFDPCYISSWQPPHPNTSQHIPRICVNSGSQSFHKRIEHVFTSLFQRKKSCFFGSIIFHQDRNYRNWLVVDLPLWKIWVRQWEGWHPIYYGK